MKISALFLSVACLATAGPALAQSRFSYSSDGSEVTDSKTSLVWRRCAEGMVWNGSTCTGTASTLMHEAALAHAKSQTGWRLPNVKELASIADRSRSYPAIDVIAFPATPSVRFWSSSSHDAENARGAWTVDFANGAVNSDYRSIYIRSTDYPVRLVR